MLGARPGIIVLVPAPLIITFPGVRVNVQVPVAGKPLNTIVPVGVVQVGCVIVPTIGGEGGVTEVITTLADASDVQPAAFVTVK